MYKSFMPVDGSLVGTHYTGIFMNLLYIIYPFSSINKVQKIARDEIVNSYVAM